MIRIEKPTLDFLKGIKKNNNREWFNENRGLYESARRNFESFIQAVIDNIIEIEPIMKGLEAGSCIYRINRDIRFSNDKSPYKTHMGAFIVRGGRKNGDKYAGYYVHVEPGNSIIAGGAYMPPAPWIRSIRERINNEPGGLRKIISDKNFIRYFGEIQGEKLKSPPRGYTSDHPEIELLKYKSFLAVREVTDNEVLDKDFLTQVISTAKAMKPMNDFLNSY